MKFLFIGGGSGKKGFSGFPSSTLLQLTDAPHSYLGKANYVLTVNPAENGIVFVLGRGVANGFASLDATGKVPSSEIPAIALTEFLGTAATEPAMLAFTGELGDWCIRSDLSTTWVIIANNGHLLTDWQEISYPAQPYKVMCSGTDLFPDYLYNKLVAGKHVQLQLLGAGSQDVEITALFTWLDPVISIFDNTAALPLLPTIGDRYIALVTANGWTIDKIYEWDGAAWDETTPAVSNVVVNTGDFLVYIYDGAGWINTVPAHAASHAPDGSDTLTGYEKLYPPVLAAYDPTGGLPVGPALGDRYIAGMTNLGWTLNHIYQYNGATWDETVPVAGMNILVKGNTAAPHAVAAIVGGIVYRWSGAAWAVTKYSGNLLFDATDATGSGFLSDKIWSGDGGVSYGTALEGKIRIGARVDGATVELTGVSPNKVISVKLLGITDAYVAAANKDGTAGTASMRTLGTGAAQAAAGNHTHSEIITKEKTLYNPSGITAAGNIIVWRAPYSCTVTNVRGYRVGGTGATINARRNGADNHLAAALSLINADVFMDGGAVQNTAYVAGDKLEIMVVTVTGSPTQLQVEVDFTRNL
jgi:hypothetical protein